MSEQMDAFEEDKPKWRIFRYRKVGNDDWYRMTGPGLNEDNLFRFDRQDIPIVYEFQEIDDVVDDNPIGEVFIWRNAAAIAQETEA